MEESMKLYQDVLGYETVDFDETAEFACFKGLPSGGKTFRRVRLSHKKPRVGAFATLLGPTTIELVQEIGGNPRKIFENRFWGDWGFIHLCFDIQGMDILQKECEEKGFPFTVDSSNTFDMGEDSSAKISTKEISLLVFNEGTIYENIINESCASSSLNVLTKK